MEDFHDRLRPVAIGGSSEPSLGLAASCRLVASGLRPLGCERLTAARWRAAQCR